MAPGARLPASAIPGRSRRRPYVTTDAETGLLGSAQRTDRAGRFRSGMCRFALPDFLRSGAPGSPGGKA
jgi:hypothetical protein